MRQPASLARFAADERLPRDAEGPVFAEPWQAEAFALTVRLHEAENAIIQREVDILSRLACQRMDAVRQIAS